MEQAAICHVCFFVSDKELSETIEPRMCDFHNPSFWPKSMQFNGFLFFAARSNMWFHSMGQHKLFFSNVSRIQAKILLNGFDVSEIQRNNAIPKKFVKYRAIVSIGSGCDERQRDAICVHQQVFFCFRFFLCP